MCLDAVCVSQAVQTAGSSSCSPSRARGSWSGPRQRKPLTTCSSLGVLTGACKHSARSPRATSAAGYLWLFFAWVVWGESLPDANDTKPMVVERVYELEGVVSSLGLAVVSSVAAYVVGSIVIDVQRIVGLFGKGLAVVVLPASTVTTFRGQYERHQLDLAKTMLLDESEALHADVDRPDTEATFRMALWPPLAALIIYAAIELNPLFLLALVLPLV